MASVEDLIRAGTIEETEPDCAFARTEIEHARRHLGSAETLRVDDPVMAYTALSDATRKAINAHMRNRGYRVKGQAGHHAKTFEYAEAALGHLDMSKHLARLDDMRMTRNDAEYRGRYIGRAEVEADLETARRVVQAIESDL